MVVRGSGPTLLVVSLAVLGCGHEEEPLLVADGEEGADELASASDSAATDDGESPATGRAVPDDAAASGSAPPSRGDAGGAFGAEVTRELPCGALPLPSEPERLVDLGHGSGVTTLETRGERMLSASAEGRWMLWDTNTRRVLASGAPRTALSASVRVKVAMAGERMIALTTPTRVELRSTTDGALLTSIDESEIAKLGLAPDGSYAWLAGAQGISVYGVNGALLAESAGDYSAASIAASPDGLDVALGPEGKNVIEHLSIADGKTSTSAPFLGSFHSWFVDGGRFFALEGSAVRVYARDAKELASTMLPARMHLMGRGGHFWVSRYFAEGASSYRTEVLIYDLTRPGAPVRVVEAEDASLSQVQVTNGVLALFWQGERTLDLVDLDDPALARSELVAPVVEPYRLSVGDAGRWTIGSAHGVLVGSADERPLTCGAAWDIAVAAAGRTAIATASGQILLFDVSRAGKTYLGSIPFASSELELSADGSVLGAQATKVHYEAAPDRTVKLFALPTGEELRSFVSSAHDDEHVEGFSLSANGERVALIGTQGVAVFTATSGAASLTVNGPGGIPLHTALSPDGRRAAIADGEQESASTHGEIYAEGELVAAVPGIPRVWLDAERLLVTHYDVPVESQVYGADGVFEPSEEPLPPFLEEVQALSPALIYAEERNAIFSVYRGVPVFTGARPSAQGAASGELVVYTPSTAPYEAIAEPYTLAP